METGGNAKEFSLSVDVKETFEPRIDVFNGIMNELEDDSVSLVGVHGMGGIGKSTLLKEISRKAKEDKFFAAVVMVVVSQTLEIKDVQDQIAEQLDFDFDWMERRDYQLLRKLKGVKNILVILDDLRMKLDLETIGIPYGQHHKRCKILLASRSLNLLTEMNTQKIFSVGILEQEAAWYLFKKIVAAGPDLQSTAIQLAKECAGLPIAISMVARALTDKSSMHWMDALQKLKRPSTELEVTHSALKFSYDHLRSEELKLTFLLCYVLGHNAAVEDLWKCGMALGLFNDTKTITQVRAKALELVFELKKSSLLLDSCSDMFFDVHDVVRDFALSIASENHLLAVVKDEDVMEYLSDIGGRKIQYVNAIILRNAHVGKLPTELNCPQLKIFYMACKNPSTIPEGFFYEVQELKVLYLNNVILFSLPSSIRVLENLRTLCLHECLLEDMAIIGELWTLEILSLSGSDIEELPYEIGYLERLRLLDLNNCTKLKYIRPGILSRLSRLEELYMMNCSCLWEIGQQTWKANLAELKALSRLTSLDIEIRDIRKMPKEDLFPGRLLRYKIYIGHVGNRSRKHESSKTVKLAVEISHHLDVGLKELINETEELYLEGRKNLHDIFGGQSFQHLKNLHLYGCWGVEYIFNPMEWNVTFPVLESLSLSYLYDLKNICRTPEVKPFDRLRILKVEGGGRLENLFSLSIFRNFLQLQEIEVVKCYNIIEVVADEREDFNENPVICNVLSLRLRWLHRLISFSKQRSTDSSPGDEALFNEKIMFPSLEDLQLSGIHVTRIWKNQLATTSCFGRNLGTLIVENSDKLEYLWSESMAGCFVQLKRLEITSCYGMKTIIQTEKKLEEITEAKILFPQLIYLKMRSLLNLQGFYPGNLVIEFPTLKQVTVKSCPELFMFSNGVVSTPKLRNIEIGEDGGIWFKDLNAALQMFKLQKSKKKGETEWGSGHLLSRTKDETEWQGPSRKKVETEVGGFRPKIKAEASGTKGEEAVKGKAIVNYANVKSLETDTSGPAIIKHEQSVSETVEVICEADFIPEELENWEMVSDESERTFSSPSSSETETDQEEDNKVVQVTRDVSQPSDPTLTLELSTPSPGATTESVAEIRSANDAFPLTDEAKVDSPYPVSVDVQVTREIGTTPVQKPLSATGSQTSPHLTAENPNIVPDETETEVTRSQKEEDNEVLQVTENVSQPSEPVSTLALSEPSTRSLVPFETERVVSPPLTAKILEVVPDENEGTLSSHEIETEAAYSQKEEDNRVQVAQNVSQQSEPALILSSSTPSTGAATEIVAEIPSANDSIPVMDEANVECPSQTEQRPEICETGVAAITTIEHSVSKILECMATDTVRRIAVQGVWGVGKSSVLRALINNPKTKREFELIIWVTVSKYWSSKKIRDQIIQHLPPSSSNAEPFQILKGKKFLLVLDDVWERIDLQEMGIPDPSMMIFATRESKVCHDMEEIRVVEIEPVSKEEALKLFHEQVGGLIDLPNIKHFAEGIVEGCCGLPLLIVVTGRALAGERNLAVWQHAFNEFSGRDIKSGTEDLIQLLKFSFDRLKSCSLKSCFIHCALLSRDLGINTNEFIEYCIQEGLIAGSWSDAYERGYDIVDALLHALFLETTNDGRSIRMRDVMRDLVLGILSSNAESNQLLLPTYSRALKPENESSSTRLSIADGHRFLLEAAAGLTEPPTAEKWEHSKMMFLMDNKLSSLPENPSCPVLETLFLQRNCELRVVPDHFFDNMPFLKVLNLSKTRIKFLPKSISNLGRLKTLILCDCERLVKLPSEVGCLRLLQVLNLRGSEIMELPREIVKLQSLNHLEVSFYGSSTYIEHAKLPRKLISSLKELKTLCISVYPGDKWWDKNARSFIKEVSKLKNLTSLSFYLPEVEFLELFLQKSAAWEQESLTEFKFVVGHDVQFNASRVPQYVQLKFGLISGQCLRFVNSRKIPDAIVEVLARCTAFHLDHHLDIRSLSEFGIGNLYKLEYCILSECPDLETIVDSEEGTEAIFPCLEHLSIHYSWSLTCIWKGVVPEGSFAALTILSLHACPKLTYVFRTSMLQFIYNLEELQVDDCEAIEKIVSTDEVTNTEFCCISLKRLTLLCLPELVNFWEGAQTKLLFEYLSVYNCPQLKQICIDSELKQTLKEIRAEQDWWDNLIPEEKRILSDCGAIFTPIREGDVYSS